MDKTSCHLLILKLLAYQISTHICKLVKLDQHGDRKFYKNLFHSKISLKRTTYLLLEAKKSYFTACVQTSNTVCAKSHTQLNHVNFSLEFRIRPFSEYPLTLSLNQG